MPQVFPVVRDMAGRSVYVILVVSHAGRVLLVVIIKAGGQVRVPRGTINVVVGTPIEDLGDYVVIWKRGNDDVWRMHVDIWNTKLPSFRMPGFRNPSSGDLVIFEFPEDPSRDFIKRCIAVAGQTVEVRDHAVFVDGKPFENPEGVKYTDTRRRTGRFSPRDSYGPYKVPPGHLFVMGDNRDNSYDSRIWGSVSLSKVKAHPLLIYHSWDSKHINTVLV